MYAKFISRTAIQPFTGRVLRTVERTYVNPTAETLVANGYLPVEEGNVAEPTDGYTIELVYEKHTDKIIKNQILVEVEDENILIE